MRTVTSRDGTVISYERSGDGAPVIVVGGATADHRGAAPLAAALPAHLSAVTYDRRGRGDSGDTLPYAVEREIEDLDALIADVGGTAFVFGESSGAVLALKAAASGLAISKVAAFEPPFRVGDGPPIRADYLDKLTELTSSGRRSEAVELFLTDAVGLPDEAVAPLRTSPMWPGLEAIAHTLVYDATIMGDGSLPADWLRKVTTPVLVLESAGSPQWLRQAAAVTAGTIPHATDRTLDGTFHDAPPERIASVLATFYAG